MSIVIGTAVITPQEDDVDVVEFKLSTEFMQCSLPERIGALYMLIDQLYDLMDDDVIEEESDEEEEIDEWDSEDLA